MTGKPETRCIDCGNLTAGGLRCKTCHGALLRRQALESTAEGDRAILAMVAEGVTGRRLAVRLGVSSTRARDKVILARSREEQRKALGV